MTTIEQIKNQIHDNPILLYMKGTPEFPQCGFSRKAVNALHAYNAVFASVNILEHPDIRQTLPQYSNWPTFPQLYINGELIGGCDIMMELLESGELKKLLASAIQP